MRFLALASDYDGTLAENGYMTAATRAAVERLRATGRKLILATGRSLDDLAQVLFPLDVFDRIVAENGAILYCPSEKRTVRLSPDLPPSLIRELQAKNVEPLWVGEVILATRKENAHVIQNALRRLQLDVEVVVNNETIMLLPAGINKATGLLAALDDLGISAERVISVGDGENDTILFEATGCGASVANATEVVKGSADHVTQGTAGAGVKELIDQIIATDLVELRRCVSGRRRAVAIASGGIPPERAAICAHRDMPCPATTTNEAPRHRWWIMKANDKPLPEPIRRPRSFDKSVSLVLQGGGALGSYQAGVYEALAEADYLPDWVAGISIGSINAAIIAGNPPGSRVARLREFWHAVTAPTATWHSVAGDSFKKLHRRAAAASALLFGQPGFFRPRDPFSWLTAPGPSSFYDSSLLKSTLERLVDFDRINARENRFGVGAVNVRTGNFSYCDNGRTSLDPGRNRHHPLRRAVLLTGRAAARR